MVLRSDQNRPAESPGRQRHTLRRIAGGSDDARYAGCTSGQYSHSDGPGYTAGHPWARGHADDDADGACVGHTDRNLNTRPGNNHGNVNPYGITFAFGYIAVHTNANPDAASGNAHGDTDAHVDPWAGFHTDANAYCRPVSWTRDTNRHADQ
jgi:hypothetical protein